MYSGFNITKEKYLDIKCIQIKPSQQQNRTFKNIMKKCINTESYDSNKF